MREGLRVESLHEDLDLLLEELAVGLGVEHGAAERLDFPRVISAADAEDGAPARQDVGGGEIFREPEGMPHGRDVEAAADAQARRQMRQVHGHHQDVREALVAFVLEVVLGQPEGVVAVLVHAARDGLGLVKHRRQVRVRVSAFVRGSGHLAHVAQVHVPGIDGRELADHVCPPRCRSLPAHLS